MAWQEPIRNQIISSVNYDIQTSSYEQSESSTINLSDIVNVSMLADNENNSENITEEIDNEESDNNSDNDTDEDLTDGESIIKEWTEIDEDEELEENKELEENEEPEEISIGTLNTADRLDCHPADHENSKIELQYLFSRILTQPSFVRIIEQDIENVETTQ
ncbi:4763_t:CDS:2 [Racocetra fulgida]|uniref:4763_t:CDS:1 n=1 Tax=Racocetra fulgida TaxID=60492 RepID=A0A9N9B0H4_9GLOM|nr:4763_t:CDS:2 [Racocetra fulgida]